jgi:hypothetical protein
LFAGVRFESRHDAATAKIVHANNDLTNSQLCSLPLAFREPSHATDYQVGAKTPAVVTHRSKHSIRRDQERKDIEAVFCGASDEASPLACRVLNNASDLLCVPGAFVHKHVAILIQHSSMPKQPGPGSRREDSSAGVPDLNYPVTRYAVLSNISGLQ